MKKDPLTPKVRERICSHMNTDHPEALIQLATRYGGIVKPVTVKMIDLTPHAIQLDVDGGIVEIGFDHQLLDSGDAHASLIEMLNRPAKPF